MVKKNSFAISICLLFFLVYAILGIIKHEHYLSGYDLAVVDQTVWKYSQLKAPISTIHAYAFSSTLMDHIEFIYILLAPFYWVYNNTITIIILQALSVSLSGLPVYLLCKYKKLPTILSMAILISYLTFYGIQNALWSDVHSLAFGSAFLPWYIFFLYKKNKIGIFVSLLLALFSKEDLGLLTFFIGFIYFITTRQKVALITMAISLLYIGSIFFIFFPYFTNDGYRFAGYGGLFSDLKLSYLYNTTDKLKVYFYSLAWFGFLPLMATFYLLPALADLSHYFIFGYKIVSGAGGLFMHYRITLAVLLIWPTIIVINKIMTGKYKKYIKTNLITLYLLLCVIIFQYTLHAPLSYLTKKWFWTKSDSVNNLNYILDFLPEKASVVVQSNITPHISHRDNIFTLWPEVIGFPKDSPCGRTQCRWFYWKGNPNYLIVDTSIDWDIRHFLTNREDFIEGVQNMEKKGVITKYIQKNTAVIYKIVKGF